MLKVAIAGCGLIATKKYIPIFQELKDRTTIVGICDLNESILKQAASKFRIHNAYVDFSKMLTQQRPDVVVVCTPAAAHTRLVVEALEKGAHVLVEKPMALTSIDCEKMVEASEKHNRKLGVMHNQIFNPAFEKACNIVSNGGIGKFLGMRILMLTSVHETITDKNHWVHRLPGGVVEESGPHAVYLSLAFLKNVKDLKVILKKHLPQYPWSIGEDCRVDLIADNGYSSVALVFGSNQAAGEVDIIGAEGYLKVDLQTRILVNQNRLQDNPMLSPKAITKSVLTNLYQTATSFLINGIRYVSSRNLDGHYIGINRFLDYVEKNAEFPATGEKGREVQAVMEMLVKKLQECTREASE